MSRRLNEYKKESQATKVFDTGGSEDAKNLNAEVRAVASEESETTEPERTSSEDTLSETESDIDSDDTDYDGMYSDNTDSDSMSFDDMDLSKSESDLENQTQGARFKAGNRYHGIQMPSLTETYSRAQARCIDKYPYGRTTILQYQHRVRRRHPIKMKEEKPRITSNADKYEDTEARNNAIIDARQKALISTYIRASTMCLDSSCSIKQMSSR